MAKKRLDKKDDFFEFVTVYNDVLFVVGCVVMVLIVVCLFVWACAYFNVSFTESGMVRNFLNGGV